MPQFQLVHPIHTVTNVVTDLQGINGKSGLLTSHGNTATRSYLLTLYVSCFHSGGGGGIFGTMCMFPWSPNIRVSLLNSNLILGIRGIIQRTNTHKLMCRLQNVIISIFWSNFDTGPSYGSYSPHQQCASSVLYLFFHIHALQFCSSGSSKTANRSDHIWSPYCPLHNGHLGSLTGVTWPGRDADLPRPSSADFMSRAMGLLLHPFVARKRTA